jgi:hypothetical protein
MNAFKHVQGPFTCPNGTGLKRETKFRSIRRKASQVSIEISFGKFVCDGENGD